MYLAVSLLGLSKNDEVFCSMLVFLDKSSHADLLFQIAGYVVQDPAGTYTTSRLVCFCADFILKRNLVVGKGKRR